MTAPRRGCALRVSQEALRHAGFRTQDEVHAAARCAELWSAENRRRAARHSLDRHVDPEGSPA